MLTRVAILLQILSFAAAAKAPSDWNGVKTLAPGTEIRVAAGTSQPIVGTLASATDTDLVVTQTTGPLSLQRRSIMSVSIKGSQHRLRNTLIGLGVGTAAGIAIGAVVGEAQAHNCSGLLCGLSLPVDAALGGAIGLVGGTLTGVFWHSSWRKIYAP